MRRIAAWCILVFWVNILSVSAQNSLNYADAKTSNGSLVADRNGNPVSFSTTTLISNNLSYTNSNPQPIGFDFYFMGNRYTHFVASSSGVMALAVASSTSSILDVFASNDLTRTFAYPPTTNNAALLAPFWDFLRTAPVGYPTVRYKLTGTAPLRTAVIEWQMKINLNSFSSQPDGIFQVRLYESTGIVEYVYGKMAIGSSSGTVTASIGFTAGSTDNRFIALKSLSTYQFTRLAVEEPATQSLVNSNVAQTIFSLSGSTNGSLTNFTFTPSPASGSFSQCFATNQNFNSMTINWVDNISNESGFALYRSTDNVSFEWVGVAAANATSIDVTGLNPNTTYYWKVVAIAEGNTQTQISLTQPTRQCSMTGTYSIGPGGNFPSIQAAIDTAVQRGVSGAVFFELNAAYSASAESFPIYFRKVNCAGSANNITLRPASGARGKQISTNLNLPVFDFIGASYYRIDGRPGGTDTAATSLLTVENSGAANVAIQVEEHSRQNIFRWLQIRGANTDDSSGVFKIVAQTPGTGNDSLLIENCFLGNSGNNYPKHLLFLSGNGFAVNDGIRLLNNNFFNHLTSDPQRKTAAIYDGGNNNNLLIRGNSFYQTAAVDVFANRSDYFEVYLSPAGTLGQYVVDSNYLGGSAPRLGGQKLRMRSSMSYCGIFSGALTGQPQTISDNTIGNFTYYFTDDQRSFTGIGFSGTFNGKIFRNLIGSATVDSSIAIGSRYDAGNVVFQGIAGTSNFQAAATDSIFVENNQVSNIWGGIGFTGNVRLFPFSFSQLKQLTLRNNLVGSTVNNRSIVNTTNDRISGIIFYDDFNSQNLPIDIRITGNTVAGLTGLSTGVWNIMNGIQLENANSNYGSILVSGNNISNLFSASGRDASGNLFSALAGISTQNKLTRIEGNTISNLQCLPGVPSGSRIAGIEAAMFNLTAAMDAAQIHANRVFGLGAGPTTPIAVEGVRIANANAIVSANMIYLGTGVDGATISTNHRFAGISTVMSYNCSVLNNSVALVGSQMPAGTSPGSSFAMLNALPRSSALYVKNNIFASFRSSAAVSASYKHYAFGSDSTINSAVQSFNGNLYYTEGTNSRLMLYRGTGISSLPEWRNTISSDEYSISANPNFLLLNGSSGNLFDLHLQSPTPAEASGISSDFLTDFDGEYYYDLTPTDIGADAGNFEAVDVSAPRIDVSFPLDSTGRLSDRLLQYVYITDNKTGVDNFSADTRPAIWFRKKNGAVASSWAFNYGTLTSGTTLNGSWEFSISYSQLDLPVSGGDTIQYYLVAQDTATPVNVGVYPFAGSSHSSTRTQLSPPANPLFYRLKDPLPRSITIGRQGRMYTSFTGTNGLFDAINNTGGLSGSTEVTVYGNLTETGAVSLEGEAMNGFSLTVRPSSATVSDIRTAATPVSSTFRLQGVKNFVIDGRFNGAGRYLQFVNDSISNVPVLFTINSNSQNVLIRNSVLASSAIDTSYDATVVVGGGENRGIELRENLFDASSAYRTRKPYTNTGVLSISDSNEVRIVGNDFSNQQFFGVYLRNCNNACRVDSNSFFRKDTVNYMEEQIRFIQISAGAGHRIRGNYFGGRAALCGGRPFTYPVNFPNYFTGGFNPIRVSTNGTQSTEISGNTIANVNIPEHMAQGAFYGIITEGSSPYTISNNLIGSRTVPNSIQIAAGSNGSIENIGILVSGSGITSVRGNTLSNLRLTNSYRTNTLTGIRIASGAATEDSVSGNTITNFYSAGTGSGIGPQYGYASVAGIDVRNMVTVTGNILSNLNSTSTESSEVTSYGIFATGTTPNSIGPFGEISRNRVSNISNAAFSQGNSSIYGILVNDGKWRISNNQVLITNNGIPSAIRIYGLCVNEALAGMKDVFYNTIMVGGDNGSQFEFTYAAVIGLNSVSSRGQVYNNLFYNNRTGSGAHYAGSYNSYPGIPPFFDSTNANHNLFVSADSNKAVYQFSDNSSLHQWRLLSGADRSSYWLSSDSVPALNFFIDTATGNLNLNTANNQCWAANGKGRPFAGLADDYDNAGVRSTTLAGGSTDIGSDEFNTTTLPPFLRIRGRHVPGGADTLLQNGRIVAIINWGNSGTLPVLGNARYFSGVWPNDATNGGSVTDPASLNAWWDIPASGGSGYSYSITLFYDSSILGTTQNASTLLLSKKQSGAAGTWQVLVPTVVNTAAGTITATGLSSFSEFTASASSAPLAYAGDEACRGSNLSFRALLSGTGYTYQWQVNTGSGFLPLTADAVYGGVNAQVLSLTNPPSSYNRYRYRCVVNTGSALVNDLVYSLKLVNRWTGGSGTAWNNTANWSCGQLPDANTDVVIPAGLVFYPNVTADVSCRSLRVQNGANVTISGNARLLLTGK
jgi:hypothetical protein